MFPMNKMLLSSWRSLTVDPLIATARLAGCRASAAALLLALAGCGGGGGGGGPVAEPSPPANRAPLAHAGAAQTGRSGIAIQLDGRASSDPDGDPLSYTWTLSARPDGSGAMLQDIASAAPRFTPDLAGRYVASLVVHDGRAASAAAQVTVTVAAGQAAPVADAGAAQQVVTGARITLSGAASSDADGDLLSYRWTLHERPAGSAAQLAQADGVAPSFVADLAGRYAVRLVVNDGLQDSAAAEVSVEAAAARLSAQVMPTAADFGSVPVGGSAARVLTVRNTGNGTLSFRPGYPATDAGVWSMGTRSCLGTLAPGAQCTVTVNFTPGHAQDYTGSVEIGFLELPTGQGGPRVALRGQGSGAITRLATVTPAVADFGDVPLGMAAARVFTVRNAGTERLSFRDGYPATDGAPWSIGARSCAGALEPGASCTVTVNFAPGSAQAYNGTVRFYFNELQDGQGNPLAGLAGLGQGELRLAAAMTPAEADFGVVPLGTSAERVFAIVNTGNGPLRLRPGSPGVEGGPWSVRGRSCTGELPVGGRCTVTIGFTPVNTQAYTGSAFLHFVELPPDQGSVRAGLMGTGG